MTVDHGIPRVRGGSGRLENLFPACFACNTQKCDMTPEEYRKYLMLRGKIPPDRDWLVVSPITKKFIIAHAGDR